MPLEPTPQPQQSNNNTQVSSSLDSYQIEGLSPATNGGTPHTSSTTSDKVDSYARTAAYTYNSTPSSTSVIGDSMTGAATGAMIGSLIPGLGTGIGALIGGVGGFLKGIFGKRNAKKAQKYNEEQVQKQNEFNASESEKAFERQRQLMAEQNAYNQANYDANFSYKAQAKQMRDAGLSVASMYNTGTQGSGGTSTGLGSAPAASSSGLSSVPVPSETDALNAQIGASRLQIDALTAGAENTRTLADATRISLDNMTLSQKNVSEILKNYAEIERLKKAGLLDDAQVLKIQTLLDSELANLDENTRLIRITADNTEEVMKSTAKNNNASAVEHYASSGLKGQQTKTEKYNTEHAKFKSFNENMTWTTSRNIHQISVDACEKLGIDKKYSSVFKSMLEQASRQAGVSLVDTPVKTIFSWLDFSNWKNIFTAKMFTGVMRQNAVDQMSKDMEQWKAEYGNKIQQQDEELSWLDADDSANWYLLSKKEQSNVMQAYKQKGEKTARALARKYLDAKHKKK